MSSVTNNKASSPLNYDALKAQGNEHDAEVTSWTFSGATHSDESFAPHSHDGDQLYWFPDGGMDVVVGSRRWLVHCDTVLWIPAGVLHSNRLLGPGSTLSIYLSPTLRPGGERWSRPRAIAFEPLIGAIMQHVAGRSLSPARRANCYRLLVDLLDEGDDRETTMPLPFHPAARAVAEAILAQPADATLLSEWASLYGISTRTIARAFEAQTGHGFTAWRAKTRLLSSLPLLLDGQPVHHVSGQVGYGTVGGFIQAFSKEFGATPVAYVRNRR